MTLIIGLTGSIASGKSTVADMFKQLNIPVIDADQISRQVVKPGEAAYQQIVEEFGKQILLEDQTIDRTKLGEIIFSDDKQRKKLNNIVHPAVRQEMLKQRDDLIKQKVSCVVLDIPLLYESNLTHFVEKTMVVYVDKATQLSRLMERNGFTEEEALQRIDAQLPVKEKAALADVVIDNNGSKQDSFDQLQHILDRWHVRL